MANDAFHAAERRWLEEPDDDCERCGDPSYGQRLCQSCDDEEYEAELQATEGNEETRS